MTVVRRADFNERFTIYLNTEGKPVQRPLRKMTAGDVMSALLWHSDEARRLEVAAAPFLDSDDDVPVPGGVSDKELMAWADRKQAEAELLLQSAEAHYRCSRLQLVIRRYWPGSRAP